VPKGDYAKLKADIEDGTVPIARLLLEAVGMTNLDGVALRIVLFILRRTYGWMDSNNQKHKDDRITLDEFAQAVNSSSKYVSKQLALLIRYNVIIQSQDPENRRYKRYGINADVSKWSNEIIDHDALIEAIESKVYVHSSKRTSPYRTTITLQGDCILALQGDYQPRKAQ